MSRDPASRSLVRKRLALRVVRHRDREAAQILGDALMEMKPLLTYPGTPPAETGRSRPVRFIVNQVNPNMRMALWGHKFSPAGPVRPEKTFYVRGHERVYNVDGYAKYRTEEQWRAIFTMWITPLRDVYMAMVREGLLPASIRFGELRWDPLPLEDMAYRLYLVRTPERRKKPVATYLFEVHREDTPLTREEHFDEAKQRELFTRDTRRRRSS